MFGRTLNAQVQYRIPEEDSSVFFDTTLQYHTAIACMMSTALHPLFGDLNAAQQPNIQWTCRICPSAATGSRTGTAVHPISRGISAQWMSMQQLSHLGQFIELRLGKPLTERRE